MLRQAGHNLSENLPDKAFWVSGFWPTPIFSVDTPGPGSLKTPLRPQLNPKPTKEKMKTVLFLSPWKSPKPLISKSKNFGWKNLK
ncbi:hypothetical protein TNIN_215571 [Trichonephila inaurata madagascariensis]|uniref:Uncharacterized protein n=1 Tax=Trichonephila inaurata madagascariensis TaxID=2747483 RepID=A0A8X6YRF1_9ARAC|nr:hypothetical protein TNIN_215561 [Trichonephila inaurata madagascariensis]GFY75662.1 hypothetical protein TNIN_215571 [Trichonephila inaurata madagascariensis]